MKKKLKKNSNENELQTKSFTLISEHKARNFADFAGFHLAFLTASKRIKFSTRGATTHNALITPFRRSSDR